MTTTDEFQKFDKIESFSKMYMTITQKIHGTNAQILIRKGRSEAEWAINAGSRTRWLTPDDDNYGFCKWVYANKDELVNCLGEGRHFGEWCGKGINAGEGLSGKMFCLFNWRRFQKYLPHEYLMQGVRVVPVLYNGLFSLEAIHETMAKLKENGSYLTPANWYMKPEGIVIEVADRFYKKVFDPEETKWDKPVITRSQLPEIDISHLLQPIRLKKLISQDEAYLRNYPESLSTIFKLYWQDLMDENQISGTEDEIRAIKKSFGKQGYPFIKISVEEILNETKTITNHIKAR